MNDEYLDGLVAEGAGIAKLIQIYGEPISKTDDGDDVVAIFNLAFRHPELLPPIEGRIGFTAYFRNGKLVGWREVARSRMGPPGK
jgi:hypothetical protein